MKGNKRIALILPHFGKLPNYFQIWLDSASKNDFIDFWIFTDNCKDDYKLYSNVKWVNMEFTQLKKQISSILPYEICLDTPYKICDYRPLFGLIFESYIGDYEFWGHCDPDIIWGNLRKFINDNILENYEKIYDRGHLILYRNIPKINYIVLGDIHNSYLNSKLVFQTKYSAHFDESDLLDRYIKNSNLKEYKKVDCADVDYMYLDFRIVDSERKRVEYNYFKYIDGHIYGENQNGQKEFAYLHLQKRFMQILDIQDAILIYPNMFVGIQESYEELNVTDKEKKQYNKIKRKELLMRRINNVKNGAINFRIRRLAERLRQW